VIKIYVGDIYEDLAVYACSQHSDAKLLSTNNLKEFYSSSSGVYYTALGDLPKDELTIYNILNKADQIEYFTPQTWCDGKSVETDFLESVQGATELILSYFAKEKQNVIGLNYLNQHYVDVPEIKSDEHDLEKRKTDASQLWVAGCSITFGKGVDKNQRYGNLVAQHLDKPVSHLTCVGSSIPWQADQILRSDLRKNDILIWGLTSENRFDYWSEVDTVRHVNPNFRKSSYNSTDPLWMNDKTVERMLLHENTKYQALKNILQVINYCKKTNTKLLLLGLLNSKTLSMLLNQFPFYFYYLDLNNYQHYKDLGTDNEHPGPQQHRLYADYVLKKLKQLEYI